MTVFGNQFLGAIAIISGIGLVINHFTKKKEIDSRCDDLEQQFEQKRSNGVQIVRATLAEVVDFRTQFLEKDAESVQVIDFLEQIKPEQYVRKLSDSTRRIRMAE